MKLWLMAALIALMTVSAYPRAAKAIFFNGKDLLKHCEDESAFKKGLCIGFIAGASDSAEFTLSVFDKSISLCIPEAVTVGQVKLVVNKYLKANPESLHESAAMSVALAIREAWPCQ